VAAGDASLDPVVLAHLVDSVACGADGPAAPAPSPMDGLTRREIEVLELIAEGLTNAQIAERLVVSPATVKSHINHLLPKIGARDRAQAVTYAYRRGVADPSSGI
jgi:DNA-binding NarL/FixJ family response regulator